MRFEETLLANIIRNEEFSRKVIPHIKSHYFSEYSDKLLFDMTEGFVSKYNKYPTKEALLIELQAKTGVREREYEEAQKTLEVVYSNQTEPNIDWLIDRTEGWCKDRATYLAVLDAVQIIDGTDKNRDTGAIPQILSDALAVCFDTTVGHDLWEDAGARYDFYHKQEEKMRSDLTWLNQVTGGGIPRKTLNLILAPTNAGKTLLMCSLASGYMREGNNVLYITMEMAEEKIAERIDSNLMMMAMDEMKLLERDTFLRRIDKVKQRVPGKLVIKEYPTAGAHAGHFKNLLQELKTKKNFTPDIIFVDYMGICLSQRVKGDANSYTVLKSVSEELRGLAGEHNLALWSAGQTNRSAMGASEFGMDAVSDSSGQLFTADFVVALIRTPELDQMGNISLKVLKSRYGSTIDNNRALLNVDFKTMTVSDSDSQTITEGGYKKHSDDIEVHEAPPWDKGVDEKPKFGEIKF